MKIIFVLILNCFSFTSCFSQSNFIGGGAIGSSPNTNYTKTSNVFTGVNIALTTLNGIQYYKGKRPNSNGGFAIITGLSQMILPTIGFEETNKKIDNLNYITGSATILIGTLMLVKPKLEKKDKVSFIPYINPFNDGLVVGIILSRN